MKPLLASLLLCLCLTPAARADDALPFAAGLDLPEETLALVIAEGEKPPQETGPGFRSFARVLLGGMAYGNSDNYNASHQSQFVGYRDYWEITSENTGASSGEVVYVGPDGNPGTYDGVVDDINGNLGNFIIVLQADPANPGEFVPTLLASDFGDLHYFNIRFNTLRVTEERPIQSFDLMGQHLMRQGRPLLDEPSALRAGYWMPGGSIEVGKLPVAERAPHVTDLAEQPQSWVAQTRSVAYFAYGVRLDQGDDRYGFDGVTDVAGRSYSFTEARHTLIGPQLGIGRVFSNDRLQLDLGGYVMLGYGDARLRQTNGFGDDTAPGGANNLIFLQPTRTTYQDSKGYFASRVEARLRASYLIKANWSIDAVARGFAHGTWYKAKEHIDYNQFESSLTPFHRGSLLDGDLYLGVTYLR